jgi:hypothetical protein
VAVGHKKIFFEKVSVKSSRTEPVQSLNCPKIVQCKMYTETQKYTKKLLFLNGPQKFLHNHQRQGAFSIWNDYFNQIALKIKK